MSIGSILNSARSGMAAQQLAVQVASQNIANADTEGYSRQRVDLATSLSVAFPYGTIGTGVTVQNISRARDAMLDAQYRQDSGGQANAETMSATLGQIQQVFSEPSDSGLSASLDAFWSAVWDFYELRSVEPPTVALAEERMPGAVWFPGTRLNYVSQILRHPPTAEPAIVDIAEDGAESTVSWAELHRRVDALAATLRELGVRQGDRVVGYLPNTSAAIIGLQATASLGANWSACGQDYAAKGAAEAQALQVRAEAYAQYNQAAILDRVLESLPEIAQSFADSLAKVDKITIVSTGDGKSAGASALTGEVAKMIAQVPTVVESLTGIDVSDLLRKVPGTEGTVKAQSIPVESETV